MLGRVGRHVRQQVVGYIALFIALGGVSYAAIDLRKNDVRSKHIKNGQVKTADLRTNAVISKKVKDGSLLAQDFAAGQLPAGAPGEQGPAGPPGPAGPQGDTGEPGTARAFGRISETGEVSLAKNMSTANVDRIAGGAYCISGLSFTPESVVASIESPGVGFDAEVGIGIGPSFCPAGTQVRVFTRNSNSTLADHPLFIVLN